MATDPPELLPRTIWNRFRKFHAKNPKVYERAVELARQAKRKGRSQFGMKMIWEVIRWETFLAMGDENEIFRLSNDFTSRYARVIMMNESDLVGIFKLRAITSP